MSKLAPHSTAKFDPEVHILRQNMIFAPPVAHLLLKWTKTLQDNKSFHVIQLPEIQNIYLCTEGFTCFKVTSSFCSFVYK